MISIANYLILINIAIATDCDTEHELMIIQGEQAQIKQLTIGSQLNIT